MRTLVVFLFLCSLKLFARCFYRIDQRWIRTPEGDPWSTARIVAFLNHTSLYEWLFVGGVPFRFLWRVAAHGVIPAAEKTIQRPVVGWFFRLIGQHVVSITRERDHTWRAVLEKIGENSMVLILPEGRMKRANGLDSSGQPMTVRGGIADILDATPGGLMLIAYSGGLHHVQAPGEARPRLFRTIRLKLEVVDIARYRAERLAEAGESGFKRATVNDLERRRDEFCPTDDRLGRLSEDGVAG